jgi:hypothetical protein
MMSTSNDEPGTSIVARRDARTVAVYVQNLVLVVF